MTAITIIETEQAPSSKPRSASAILTTDWLTMVDVPQYNVPLVGFGSSRRLAPGVAEPSAPVMFVNTSSATQKIDVRIIRNYRPVAQGLDETTWTGTYTSGQGYVVGDHIYMNAVPRNFDRITTTLPEPESIDLVVRVDAVDGSGSVTEFTTVTAQSAITSVDGVTIIDNGEIFPETLIRQVAVLDVSETLINPGDRGTDPSGFTLVADREDLDINYGTVYLGHQLQVEPDDVLMLPLNGQFFQEADQVQIKASSAGNVHCTVSYTEGQAEEDQIYF
jgi:hypothetical protein